MDRSALLDQMHLLLANSYTLYLKTQNYHWNVIGENFYSLHLMFEEQYTELAEAIDEIAEIIRIKGSRVDASFESFSKLKTISESPALSTDRAMIEDLVDGHKQIIKNLNEICALASEEGNKGIEDLATQRIRSHEKSLWKLQSSL